MTQDNDWKNLTFSQRNGYEDIPRPLKLEELDKRARGKLYNIFYSIFYVAGDFGYEICPLKIFNDLFIDRFEYLLDELEYQPIGRIEFYKNYIIEKKFNEVFDTLEYIMRHPKCPKKFIRAIKKQFEESQLAYVINEHKPPTIYPATTKAEGVSLLQALEEIRKAGLTGAEEHLRQASSCIHQNDWKGSIRESIHAVESVARQIDPKGANTLKPALDSLEKRIYLHPAFKEALIKLYGYTSDEQGIRHASLGEDETHVGSDEALYMLGACASFASYLWRKYKANKE